MEGGVVSQSAKHDVCFFRRWAVPPHTPSQTRTLPKPTTGMGTISSSSTHVHPDRPFSNRLPKTI